MIRKYGEIVIDLNQVKSVCRVFQKYLIFCYTENILDSILDPYNYGCEVEFENRDECIKELNRVTNLLKFKT